MHKAFVDYYRCPAELVSFVFNGFSGTNKGFFRFGGVTCYGRTSEPVSSIVPLELETLPEVSQGRESAVLPFDLSEVAENFRHERYLEGFEVGSKTLLGLGFIRWAYYVARPLLPVAVRRQFQKLHLDGWKQIPFPRWPIDASVDDLMRSMLRLQLETNGGQPIPFIWFWPESYPACAILTHDVEEEKGCQSCIDLLRIDQSYSLKSSFQLVPEDRYEVPPGLFDEIKRNGFEVNVHDLNHDGHLFRDRPTFLQRAARINAYGKKFGAEGFRSGSMYRNTDWLADLDFSYDMSVPNAAHLEPQRGGCCTVMPYSLGKVIELPLTVTQDYTLLHILREYSTELWEAEIEYLIRRNGLVSIIVHPDYVMESRALALYRSLLEYLSNLRDQGTLWMPLPRDVAHWWRMRSRMQLERRTDGWTVMGEGSDRATVAYASLEGEQLVYRVGTRRIVDCGENVCPLPSQSSL